ncbi:MAG TPA: serine hydrolase [Gemmatimonadales bacterium]|jgi:CubicO group peptidase (beta-lactamase class C family)|nr:serine hydrolase [Gemmatimonadales bacterium]
MITRALLASALVVVGSGSASAQLPASFKAAAVDAAVEKARAEFRVPGVAIGIVKDGRLVYAKGFGVRKLGENVAVTPDTRFGIASNSKAFTTTALAMLVEEGKLDWNERVITYLPWFRLHDPYVTREIRVRDLLSHKSGLGLGGGDLMAWLSDLPTDSIVRKIRGLPPRTSFRSTYEYNNIMFAVAGELIPAVTGESWAAFVTRRILKPLGMTRSVATLAERGANGNDAAPHIDHEFTGKPVEVIPDSIDNIAAAASIQSTVQDVAKWVATQLDSGRVAGGAPLWKPTTTRMLWGMQTAIPINPPAPEFSPLVTNYSGYALGFVLRQFRGHQVVMHTGGLNGMVTQVTLFPAERLGIIVLTNNQEPIIGALTWTLADAMLGSTGFDWVAAARAQRTRTITEANAEVAKAMAAENHAIQPTATRRQMAGAYRDAWYGDLRVVEQGEGLALLWQHSPRMAADLHHFRGDTWIARFRDRVAPDAFVTFMVGRDGVPERMRMEAISPLADFSFDYQDLNLVRVR